MSETSHVLMVHLTGGDYGLALDMFDHLMNVAQEEAKRFPGVAVDAVYERGGECCGDGPDGPCRGCPTP